MSLRLQSALLIAAGVVAALWAGFSLANESFLIPAVLVAISIVGVLAWTRIRYEAVLLAAALFGYIVGNRGFAQFMVIPNLPLLVAELTLGASLVAVVFAMAITKVSPVRRDLLNLAVGLWVIVGGVRLVFDIRVHGFVALRDSAMCYYALFFFIAQVMAREDRTRLWVERSLLAALALLPFTFIAWVAFPEAVMGATAVRGVPLILYKGDIAATMMAAGVFLFFDRANHGHRSAWIGVAACFIGALVPLTRAAVLGIGIALAWQIVARRARLLLALLALGCLGALCEMAVTYARREPLQQSRAVQIVRYAATILPFTDATTMQTETGDVKGNPVDNNFFRLVWWETIIAETLQEQPIFGLGFGHDLASQFLVEYGLIGDTEFTARSPHSILVSALGRLGIVGALIFFSIIAGCAVRTHRAMRAWRDDSTATRSAMLWSMCWVILVSACFGVVLEGPMGAVVFWTVLGLANGSQTRVAAEEATVVLEEPATKTLTAPSMAIRAQPHPEVS